MAGKTEDQANGQATGSDTKNEAMDDHTKTTLNSSEKPPEPKQPSKLKQLWQKSGLDTVTLIMMLKGSLPPTIGIAMYQSTAVQKYYGSTGYLIAISSALGFCIMPRGKFIQNMMLNIIAICLASAINLLALFCVTKAREHTTPPDTPPDVVLYNSTASTVCGVWLVVQVYIINAVRAARPQFMFPAILCSIFVSVSLTYGVMFPNMTAAISFMTTLLVTFLTGFALATGVHFVVFPLSSRKVVFKEMTGYMMLMSGCLKGQTAYMASLETIDPVELKQQHQREAAEDARKPRRKRTKHHTTILETPALAKLRETQNKLFELHAKLGADITPAKREFAYGKLESHDITLLWNHMKQIFLPVAGLNAMISILERQAERLGWAEAEGTAEQLERRHHQLDNLHFLLKELHDPFASMVASIDGAFNHVLLTLGLVKPPKKKQTDEENTAGVPPKPGTAEFAEFFQKKVDDFHSSKQKTLRNWAHEHNIDLPDDFFESSFICPESLVIKDEPVRERYQRQLFFTLYLEYLLGRVSTSLLEMILFVAQRKQDGVFNKSKLIFPGSKTLYKWIKATLASGDVTEEDSYTRDMDAGHTQLPYLGREFEKRRDPEHFPPQNKWEKIGNSIRSIPRFFRSQESMFGLRVAAATMTVGIICYLHDTQAFFLRQRLLWAMIMIAISMTQTAGQSFLNFVLRVLGTAVAMVGAFIIWYIVDGRIPGVIVFLWLWMFLAFYVVLKFPKFVIVGILSLVTQILIIGYELQVKTIGVELATQNGQPAYPTYELAPYRLATVAGGLFVAFVWTIFPYPVSESSELRRDISASLYLMSSFYSAVHETIRSRIQDTGGDQSVKGTHAYNLEKARTSIFTKLISLVTSLQTSSAFSKFQIVLGGRFPRQEYENLIECVKRLMLWTSLASLASQTYDRNITNDTNLTTWSSNFRQLLAQTSVTSNRITSLLSLLSSSFSNGQPLPPYLNMPEPFQFVKRLEAIDRDILSIRHFDEPEYSAFAVMQVVSQNINTDILLLLSLVKSLVGEIDYSFRSSDSSASSLKATSSADSEDDKPKIR